MFHENVNQLVFSLFFYLPLKHPSKLQRALQKFLQNTMDITWYHTDISHFFEALETIGIIEISPKKKHVSRPVGEY